VSDPVPSSRSDRLRAWYDRNAARFSAADTLESAFLKLEPQAQRRLNHFKLAFLEPGGVVSLRGQRVLEYGCGHGRLAMETRDQRWRSYTGVDFCMGLIDQARARLAAAGLENVEFVCADCLAHEAPAEAAFDVVCSLGMFEFVEDAPAVLRKMVSHLAPGGTLFIDVHNKSPLFELPRRVRWRMSERRGGLPKRSFAAREVRRLLEACGLVDVRVLMTEYPLLGSLYARSGNERWFRLREALAHQQLFDPLATDFVAVAKRPS
jgi:2-polyprenyl-3-methyl-5-hydroxy-6-metoxy-1,4-benzoquinol methylase